MQFSTVSRLSVLFFSSHAQAAVVSFSSSVPSDPGKSFAISADGDYLYSITRNTDKTLQVIASVCTNIKERRY